MSSNQNNSSSKRIKSIRRRLTTRIVTRKISVCLGHDLILFLLVICTYLATLEFVATGNFIFKERNRAIVYENINESIVHKDAIKGRHDLEKNTALAEDIFNNIDNSLKYRISDIATGKVIYEAKILLFVVRAFTMIAMLYLFQVAIYWLSYPAENKRVRRILAPINEIALKADEIARFDFSEDKYLIIEEKITSIEPTDDEKISLGDEDLLGIENAMNSLISRIRESNKQQARFVNDASHELRTPIAVIQGYANMLARWGREDEKVLDESINAILHESNNMKNLVEQLLFLARGDAGRTVINKTEVNLNALMQEVYEESLMIDENHIYKLRCADEDVFVLADEGLIKQAVRILVDNAAKYTNTKDEIILSTGFNDKDEAYLQVQDSGIGMKEVDIEHMFERFYRADEARSFNGTGLGLSIAKWIVDKHEGHFEIVSREDLGTRIGMYYHRLRREEAR